MSFINNQLCAQNSPNWHILSSSAHCFLCL